jgi:hypothetical protein
MSTYPEKNQRRIRTLSACDDRLHAGTGLNVEWPIANPRMCTIALSQQRLSAAFAGEDVELLNIRHHHGLVRKHRHRLDDAQQVG